MSLPSLNVEVSMVHVRWSPTSVVTGALTAVALACDAGPTAPAPARVPSGPSLAVVDHRRDQPFAFDVDACDQTVHVSGEFHILNTVTITRSGNRSDDIHINAEGSGVGTSGARYNWNDVINQSAHEPADQAPLILSGTENTQLIGGGSVSNIRIRIRFHLTINANGDTTAEIDNATAFCQTR